MLTKTLIRMGRDVMLLLILLLAGVGYVAGFTLTQVDWVAALFAVAGGLIGLVFVAVFDKASR